jgi:tetratricopeptide (TPR) repeat protein
MGLYYYSQNNYEEAIKEWKKCIELDRSPLSNKYLSECLANITKAEYKLTASKKIITASKTEKSENEKLINKYYYLGVAYYTSGDYKKAYEEWQ